jgi:nitrogen fixation protein FixH
MTTDKKVPFYKLTKKEKKHLKEQGITTLTQFKSVREAQKKSLSYDIKTRKDYLPGLMEPCWECKMMARRLGLETQESQSQLVTDALKEAGVE